ncbi:MAG: hypothetical protein ACREFF_05330 [Candidatus Udaeobacter sp.]
MPQSKRAARSKIRGDLVRSITTPLGFFVLALLIVEVTLGIVLTQSKLSEEHVWQGFLCMIAIFVGVILIVAVFTILGPRNLLYGKEEHLVPQLQPLALRDQIEDLIHLNVRPEALTNPKPE